MTGDEYGSGTILGTSVIGVVLLAVEAPARTIVRCLVSREGSRKHRCGAEEE
jgi:hypothetical protein